MGVWDEILKKQNISLSDISNAILELKNAPKPSVVQLTKFPISPLKSVFVGGPRAAVAALLALRIADSISYVVTTSSVADASNESQFYPSKVVALYIVERYGAKLIRLPDDVSASSYEDVLKHMLQIVKAGGIMISGAPYILATMFAQIAGFGRLYIFDQQRLAFYVL